MWAYFTVTVYVTRTNWKLRADAYEKAYKEIDAAREKEYRDNQANREAVVRMYAAEKDRADKLETALTALQISGRKINDDYTKIEQTFRETDVETKKRDARIKTIQDELAVTRTRNTTLEDGSVKLVLLKEAADREKLRAENEAKLARAIADDNAKKVETLTRARHRAAPRPAAAAAPRPFSATSTRFLAPLPENIRGTVTRDMVDNFFHFSIGIDAGLEPGSRLDVFRESGGGKYLGTVVVTKSIYPKEAVAEFRPARRVPVSQLRPDELPRKGDIVGLASVGTR